MKPGNKKLYNVKAQLCNEMELEPWRFIWMGDGPQMPNVLYQYEDQLVTEEQWNELKTTGTITITYA